jgi:hypothetical protein
LYAIKREISRCWRRRDRRLQWRVELGKSSAVLRRAISDLATKQRRQIVLNLRDVSEIDSAGVGEPVAAYTMLKNNDGRLKLLNPATCSSLRNSRVYTKEESVLRSFE